MNQQASNLLQTASGTETTKNNKFFKLLDEKLSPDQLQVAICTLTIQDEETWAAFKPQLLPTQPFNYEKDHIKYLSIKDPKAKSDAWVGLKKKYGKYLTKVYEVTRENNSNLHFLRHMVDVFTKVNIGNHVQITKQRIGEYL